MAHQPDYIQLRDIKRFAQESFRALKTQWYVPFGLFLLLGTYKVYRAWTYAPEYEARLSFMIAEEPIGLEGSLGGVLSSIGLSSESSYNHERFIQLAKSRKIFQKAVMDTVSIDGHPKLLANALIDEFERYARWGKNHWYEFFKDPPALRGYRFRDTQITAGPPLARLALKTLHQMTNQIEGGFAARIVEGERVAARPTAGSIAVCELRKCLGTAGKTHQGDQLAVHHARGGGQKQGARRFCPTQQDSYRASHRLATEAPSFVRAAVVDGVVPRCCSCVFVGGLVRAFTTLVAGCGIKCTISYNKK